jgi:5-methylcytosine-specific restriction protein B
MKIGDLIIISDGNTKIRAIGKVAGEYEAPMEDDPGQTRLSEWLVVYKNSLPREKILNISISQKTLYQLKEKNLKMDALKSILSADQPKTPENHVLIIDEINRGNISKVLGELITLIEPDKRIGAANELEITLPYSGDNFGVPFNLYIIGTMNTADRSIAFLDTALRRRFQFEEVMPDSQILKVYVGKVGVINGIDLAALLDTINQRIEILYDRDHQIGHSYLMKTKTLIELRGVFLHNIIPLLQEYFYEDWEKLCMVLGCPYDSETGKAAVANKLPIITSTFLDSVFIKMVEYDGAQDRLQFQSNPSFRLADEEDLKPFFIGMMDAEAGNGSIE